MVNIGLSATANSQLILREILQNKDTGDCDINKTTMHEIKPLVNVSENRLAGNELNDQHATRHNSDRDSETCSDEESSFLDQSRVDETELEDAKSDADETQPINRHALGEETKMAKRARVENLLTSMQHPSHYLDMETMYGLNEVRRQKRKQTLPQQHEQPTKSRRLDGQYFDNELWGLRQLSAMQNYFRQYEDSVPKPMNGFEGMDNIHRLHQAYFANLSARHAEERHREQTKAALGAIEKKVSSDKDHFNIAEHVRETVNANKGLSLGVAELNDRELNELIACLKSKIEEAVSVTVDKELSKFFSKRNKEKESIKERMTVKEESLRNGDVKHEDLGKKTTDHSLHSILQLPEKTSNNNNNNTTSNGSAFRLQGHNAFELPNFNGGISDVSRASFPPHPPLGYPPLSFYLPTSLHQPSMYPCPIVPPEQNEPLSLVVNTPKKKRTKVTDTRLSPRAARALLHETSSLGSMFDHERALGIMPLNPSCLPTSVAIPNPSLQQSDFINFYKEQAVCHSPSENDRNTPTSSNSPSEGTYGFMKSDFYNDTDGFDPHCKQTITDTLTPMHLRKAKLMFFYVRYPSSAILKVYFPDVQFNKNNTAQLVKWFSNFREFYYIQMEKYARQAKVEGIKHADELIVTNDSELYRVLNLHYNRNNQIEVPENFRLTVQATLREFYVAVMAGKDADPSWKKPIYKVIARLDDSIPEFFKSPNWMDQLSDN